MLAGLTAAATGLAVLTACGSSGPSGGGPSGGTSTAAENAPKLIFGTGPTLSAAPAFIAADKGYFKEFGVDAELTTAAFPSDKALPSLAKGDFTIVAMAFDAGVFNAIDRAALVEVLSNYAHVPETGPSIVGVLVSKKAWDAGLTTPDKLKGKKIGVVAYGGFAEYNTYQAMQAGGLKSGDATMVTMSVPDLGPALANGSVDAGWCSEPSCTALVSKGIAKRLPFEANKGVGIFQMFVNADYAKKYPQAVSKAMAAWLKAAKELNNGGWNDPADLAIVSKYTKIPVDTLKQIPALQGATSNVYTVTKADLAPSFNLAHDMQDYLHSTGKLTYKDDLDLSKGYNPKLIENALKLVGN